MEQVRYIGIFNSEELFDKAVHRLTELKIGIEEIYSPMPVHHAVRSIAGKSKIPTFAYFLGITAVISIFSFLYYAAVISWPLNFGGKPSAAIPSFIIVTLVLTILTVTIVSSIAFSISAKLYPGKKPIIFHERATDDKFIIVVWSDNMVDTEKILKENGAHEVINQF